MKRMDKAIKKIKTKIENSTFNFVDFSVPIIDLIVPTKYSPNGRYDNRIFLICLIDFVNTQVSWRKYKGTHEYPIKGTYLNRIRVRISRSVNSHANYAREIHNKYVKNKVYEEINRPPKINRLASRFTFSEPSEINNRLVDY